MRSVRRTETDYKVEDQIFWKGRFWAQNETVKKWWKVISVCSNLNRHVQMKVAERGMNDSDEEFWAIYEACSKDEVKHAGWSDEWLWVMKMVWSEWRKVKSVCCDCEEAEQIRGHTDTVAEWYWEFCERDDFTFNSFRNYKPVKRFQSLGCVCVCVCVRVTRVIS